MSYAYEACSIRAAKNRRSLFERREMSNSFARDACRASKTRQRPASLDAVWRRRIHGRGVEGYKRLKRFRERTASIDLSLKHMLPTNMKPIPRPSEAHVHAILQDIIVAVWELRDLTRDLQREKPKR